MKQIKLLLILLLLIPLTNAILGVSAPYSKNNPLILSPGQTEDVSFKIKNAGEEKISVKTEIFEGENIVQLVDQDETYTIEPNQEAEANIKITLPDTAKPGEEYKVIILFKPTAKESEGTIQFVTNIGIAFPVIVKEKSAQPAAQTPKQQDKTQIKKSPIENIEKSKFTMIKNNTTTILLILTLSIILIVFVAKEIYKKRRTKMIETSDLKELRRMYQQQTRNP